MLSLLVRPEYVLGFSEAVSVTYVLIPADAGAWCSQTELSGCDMQQILRHQLWFCAALLASRNNRPV